MASQIITSNSVSPPSSNVSANPKTNVSSQVQDTATKTASMPLPDISTEANDVLKLISAHENPEIYKDPLPERITHINGFKVAEYAAFALLTGFTPLLVDLASKLFTGRSYFFIDCYESGSPQAIGNPTSQIQSAAKRINPSERPKAQKAERKTVNPTLMGVLAVVLLPITVIMSVGYIFYFIAHHGFGYELDGKPSNVSFESIPGADPYGEREADLTGDSGLYGVEYGEEPIQSVTKPANSLFVPNFEDED